MSAANDDGSKPGGGHGDEDALAPLPGGDGVPPIDFVTFVLSLSTTCMIQLGELEASSVGAPSAGVDLAAARHTIEILEMLEQKTRGNLGGDEERVIEHVVNDLRARYLKRFPATR